MKEGEMPYDVLGGLIPSTFMMLLVQRCLNIQPE
jgi:hypothetical protein